MIKSMTGYGRAQMPVDGMNITVEIKSRSIIRSSRATLPPIKSLRIPTALRTI